ncbi:V-type ATP synthase subunit I [Pontiella sp.]|uniref:V-type ATP synthase subunit I n=1 Tax=Pontiella sp. TaxID=2837462 RepID=UPI0035625E37
MIVKMKKLTLLCTKAQQEQTLEKLRDLKVVHVQHVQAPDGHELDRARNHLLHVQRAREVLAARPDADPTGKDPDQLVDTVWQLLHKQKELQETLQALEHELVRITPFGEFDPRKIKKLNDSGIVAKLYELPIKDTPEIPEGVSISEINRGKNVIYVLAVGRQEFTISAHEVRLPDQSLSQIGVLLEKTKHALEKTDAEFLKYAGDKKLADEIADSAADTVSYVEVKRGMGSEESIVYLRGYYPAERESDLEAAAEANGWGYVLEDVSADDEPPTLLRNPKWVKPIQAVLDVIGVVPGYKELDVSALFLIFLSVFFAFLIGDAGYGLLFIALTLFGKFKSKGNAAAQPGLNLLLIMSSCCVVFGALTGNYFGIPTDSLWAPLQGLTSDFMTGNPGLNGWGTPEQQANSANNVMFICFIIGTVHITIAHVWNFIRKINSLACLADLGWICSTWALFFLVLEMVIGVDSIPVPMMPKPVLGGLVGTGATLIIVSLLTSRQYFGLVTLALDLINNFVDIISYVRLYAVGAASLAIAVAFNEMAAGIGFKGFASLGAAFILFLGHGLNIILCTMGILVHGIRLNTLEFSGHAGVEWGGIHYNPFKKKNETLN